MKMIKRKNFISLLGIMIVMSMTSVSHAQWPTLDVSAIKEGISSKIELVKQSKIVTQTTQLAGKMNSAIGDAKSSMSKFAGDNLKKIQEQAKKLDEAKKRIEEGKAKIDEAKEKAQEAKEEYEKAQKTINEAKQEVEKAKQEVNNVKSQVEEAKATVNEVKETANAAKDLAQEKVSSVQNKVDDARSDVNQATGNNTNSANDTFVEDYVADYENKINSDSKIYDNSLPVTEVKQPQTVAPIPEETVQIPSTTPAEEAVATQPAAEGDATSAQTPTDGAQIPSTAPAEEAVATQPAAEGNATSAQTPTDGAQTPSTAPAEEGAATQPAAEGNATSAQTPTDGAQTPSTAPAEEGAATQPAAEGDATSAQTPTDGAQAPNIATTEGAAVSTTDASQAGQLQQSPSKKDKGFRRPFRQNKKLKQNKAQATDNTDTLQENSSTSTNNTEKKAQRAANKKAKINKKKARQEKTLDTATSTTNAAAVTSVASEKISDNETNLTALPQTAPVTAISKSSATLQQVTPAATASPSATSLQQVTPAATTSQSVTTLQQTTPAVTTNAAPATLQKLTPAVSNRTNTSKGFRQRAIIKNNLTLDKGASLDVEKYVKIASYKSSETLMFGAESEEYIPDGVINNGEYEETIIPESLVDYCKIGVDKLEDPTLMEECLKKLIRHQSDSDSQVAAEGKSKITQIGAENVISTVTESMQMKNIAANYEDQVLNTFDEQAGSASTTRDDSAVLAQTNKEIQTLLNKLITMQAAQLSQTALGQLSGLTAESLGEQAETGESE